MSWWTADSKGDTVNFDESDVRVRPSRHGSRPRSKQRPSHHNAEHGHVIGTDRGRYSVLINENSADERQIVATKARELARNSAVTGDFVRIVGDTSGTEGSLARIVSIEDRTTLLRRSADDTDVVERVIVANADQLLIVVAAANPEPRTALVDRYLVAAFDAGIKPIVCLTKADVRDPTDFISHFSCFNLPCVVSSPHSIPLEQLTTMLVGHTTVAVGHSGVGKSTLVNALVPGADRAIGHVNAVTGRGRHTSSSTVSLRIRDTQGHTGWIIDTPGVRSFGLGHVKPSNVLKSFASHCVIPPATEQHSIPLAEAHDWEIIDRVENGELGEIGRERLHSLQNLISSVTAQRP
jgi:ribosome biogenesis GTPase